MGNYSKYDISTKVALVEEYLARSKVSPIKISQFAYEKGIADSTFNDWVIKYKRNKDQFISGSKSETVNLVPTSSPGFIELTKNTFEVIDSKSSAPSFSSIKLNYKDVSLEFSVNELDRVMEILKRW